MGGDFSDTTLARLSSPEVVSALKRLPADDPVVRTIDIDVVARRIDPDRLSTAEFVDLLAALTRLAQAGVGFDLSTMHARTFARIIAKASGCQIVAVMGDPVLRGTVLDELFRRMTSHFIPDRAPDGRHVTHLRITGGSGADGYDHYVAVIENRTCTLAPEVPADVTVQITLGPVDLLRLATGNASPTMLFLRGRVRVRGSFGFATAFLNLFDIPSA